MIATSVSVLRVERRVRPGMMPSLFLAPGVQDGTPDVPGWYGEVTYAGSTFELSRLDGENRWVIDALWLKNGYPVFSNGFGARYLGLKLPAEEVIEALDNALACAGGAY